jgi:hypothetical protein
MIEEFLKKVYINLKEIFTETENPLYGQFYNDETKGFETFKHHAKDDYTLFWIYERDTFTDEDVKSVTSEIIRRINRYYYMSKH